MDRAILKSAAKQDIKGKIGILFAISLLMSLISGALAGIPVLGTIAGLIIGGGFSLASANIYLGVSRGIKPEIGDMFSYMKHCLTGFCATFLIGLFTFLWSLLLFVPGIIKACAYSQTMYILADDPSIGAIEAISRSKEMMEGHKMEYFVMCLSFFGWAILGAFTLGILYIWLIPYMETTYANFHRSLQGEYIG